MIAPDLGLGALEQELWRIVFLMTRIGAAMLAAPLFGAIAIPMMVRLCLTGAIALFVANWMPGLAVPPAILSLSGVLCIGGEVLVGLAMGFVLQISFAAPLIAAELISGGMGMSMAVGADPGGHGQTPVFGQYFTIALTLIFLALNAHLQWLAVLIDSYQALPPNRTWLGAERFVRIAGFAATMFETAARIALPVTLILLLVQVLTGVLSRSAPSLNLFALGLPAGVLAGLAAMIAAAPFAFEQLADLATQGVADSGSLLQR